MLIMAKFVRNRLRFEKINENENRNWELFLFKTGDEPKKDIFQKPKSGFKTDAFVKTKLE
jgi:hypothetical protein